MLKRVLLVIAVFLSVGVILFSYNKTKELSLRSDYYVFYQAGQNYAAGSDLYSPYENIRPFLYPPFAALLFQGLTFVPFRLSAHIFCLFNFFVLLPFVFYMLLKSLRNFGFSQRALPALIFAAIGAAHFFWSNLSMLQMNFVVFAICTTGIFFFSKKLVHLAAVCFVVATFIKVLPVFFLIFIVLSNLKSRKVLIYTTVTIVICLIVSVVPRGIETGISDHFTYYNAFLKEFQEGRVITTNSNHTLKSFVLKAFYPETRNAEVDIQSYQIPLRVANIILLLFFIAASLISTLTIKRHGGRNYLIVFSLIFIFMHLVSGITWTAHLVTAMFFYLPLFLLNPRYIKNKTHKIFQYVFMVLAFFLTIEGRDTTGEWLYNVLSFYDVMVIFPSLLFIYYIYLFFNKSLQIENTGKITGNEIH